MTVPQPLRPMHEAHDGCPTPVNGRGVCPVVLAGDHGGGAGDAGAVLSAGPVSVGPLTSRGGCGSGEMPRKQGPQRGRLVRREGPGATRTRAHHPAVLGGEKQHRGDRCPRGVEVRDLRSGHRARHRDRLGVLGPKGRHVRPDLLGRRQRTGLVWTVSVQRDPRRLPEERVLCSRGRSRGRGCPGDHGRLRGGRGCGLASPQRHGHDREAPNRRSLHRGQSITRRAVKTRSCA